MCFFFILAVEGLGTLSGMDRAPDAAGHVARLVGSAMIAAIDPHDGGHWSTGCLSTTPSSRAARTALYACHHQSSFHVASTLLCGNP